MFADLQAHMTDRAEGDRLHCDWRQNMCDKSDDEAIDDECGWGDEPVNLQSYSDHRRGDLDSYPVIAVCEGCADELGGDLGGGIGPAPGLVLFCE